MSSYVVRACVQKKQKRKTKSPKEKEKELKKEKKQKRNSCYNSMLQASQEASGPLEGQKIRKKVSNGLGRPGRSVLFCTCFLLLLLPATASVTFVAVESESCLCSSSLGNYTRDLALKEQTSELPGNGTRAGASHGVLHR